MTSTGFKDRLLTDHPFPIHLAVRAVTVKNIPMTTHQLNRKCILVLDGDPVGKYELRLIGISLIECFHTDLNAGCDLTDHT